MNILTNTLMMLPFAILGSIIFFTVMSLVFAVFVMFLWNALMPHLFGLAHINFMEAFGLLLLSSFLLKSGVSVSSK